ncbi:MAG: hypothetical protein QOI47_1474 [Actinomycetota bacterium]|nr:hypothetical protein [Actinomycetota bacterium]
MRRPIRLLIAAGVLVAAAFVVVYLVFFNSSSPPAFKLTPAGDQAQSTASTGDISGRWTVASGSEAGYRVREKLASLPAQSDAVGRTSGVTGSVVIAGTKVSAASFTVDVTTLKSDQDRRDGRVQGALETSSFPTATFVLTTPIDLTSTTAAKVTVNAVGELTLHGVKKTVTIPIQAARSGANLELVGSLGFPMSDFGINPPSIGGFVTVEPKGTLEFKILLARA